MEEMESLEPVPSTKEEKERDRLRKTHSGALVYPLSQDQLFSRKRGTVENAQTAKGSLQTQAWQSASLGSGRGSFRSSGNQPSAQCPIQNGTR